ncbi:MAG: glycosyltransferase family 4 protein [Dehalococcoidia bacterium]
MGVLVGAMKMRLAFVVTHPIPNQAPLYRRLAEHPEIDLTVFFASRWGLRPSYDRRFGRTLAWDVPLTDGYRHRFLCDMNLLRRPRMPIGLVNPALPWRLWRGRFDAVVVHGYATLPSLLAIVAAKLARTPVLLRVETPPRGRPWFVRLAKRTYLAGVFACADAFLYTGVRARAFCLSYGARPERLFRVPYAVENERFAAARGGREEAREALGIAADRCVALFCAKLMPLKRPLDVVRAAAKAGDPRLLLLVAGDGELSGAMTREAERLGVDMRPLGFVNQAALPRVYAASDLLVLASDTETWGLVVNEALAAGLPVLVTDTAGCAPDLVHEGENGRSFAPGDIDALATGLAELTADSALRRAWGERSREIARCYGFDTDVNGILAAVASIGPGRAWSRRRAGDRHVAGDEP